MKTYIFIGLSIKIDIKLNKSLQRRPKRSSETSDELGKMLSFCHFHCFHQNDVNDQQNHGHDHEHRKSGELELVYPGGRLCETIKNTGHSWQVDVFRNEELGNDGDYD